MKILGILLAASALVAAPAAAQTTLYSATNSPGGTTPVSVNFIAGSTSTTLTFGGYDVPSFSGLTDIYLHETGQATDLLATSFTYTPASCGALASQGGPGAFGNNNLSFGGVCTGSYDVFSQSFASLLGTSYTLSFNATSSGAGNMGFLVQATNAQVTSAVPEPGTWAMMLLGFGAIGLGLRRRVKTQAAFA